jgi:hypothetical protein
MFTLFFYLCHSSLTKHLLYYFFWQYYHLQYVIGLLKQTSTICIWVGLFNNYIKLFFTNYVFNSKPKIQWFGQNQNFYLTPNYQTRSSFFQTSATPTTTCLETNKKHTNSRANSWNPLIQKFYYKISLIS